MAKRRRYTAAEKAEAVRRYVAGEYSTRIARDMGTNHKTILGWTLAAGHVTRGRGFGSGTPSELARKANRKSRDMAREKAFRNALVSYRLHLEGKTYRQIRELTGYSVGSIGRHIEMVESRRNPSERERALADAIGLD